MLSDYVTWWAGQMRGWIPARLLSRDPVGTHALILHPADEPHGNGRGLTATLLRQGRERSLGRFTSDAAGLRALQGAIGARARPPAIVLRLPPALLLEREVVLPLAAERDPERVLAFEMDRITPFAVAEIVWTFTVVRRDRARGRLSLRLSVVTRAAVQELRDALTRAGLGPTLLELPGADGTPRHIPLYRADTRRQRLARRGVAVAAAGCGALALAVAALPFAMQASADRRIEARIAALQPAVAEADILRRRIAAGTAGVDVVAAERARLGDVLAVLAAVTELLPDDTSLTDLTLRQGKLTLNGQSGAAVRLIATLSTDPVLRNPEFVAPVTRLDSRTDLFAIRAEIGR